jgi:anti-sigma factor (TIGR02949 family)
MHEHRITCEEVLSHLLAYLDREMDAPTAADLERHLEECRACFSRAEFEKKLKAHLRAAGSAKAPQRLRSRIRDLIGKF